MKNHVTKFLQDEDGVTIVEYAVAAGVVAATIAFTFALLGDAVLARINNLIAALLGG